MQQALFDTATPALPAAAGTQAAPLQRWWRLQGEARRRGRAVEPLLVTPRFLARIDSPVCPVSREAVGAMSGVVVPLRPDAALAAGHLVTLGAAAAAAAAEIADAAGSSPAAAWAVARRLGEQPGARQGGLDAAAWGRMAVLFSFVRPISPAEAAAQPLLVLPPNRIRVLSPVQGLQVAATLALRGTDRAVRLLQLAALPRHEEQRQALRVLVLTLLARCPAALDTLAPRAARHALEDLWNDPLLQRRWQRLALRLSDAEAQAILQRAHATRLLGGGWRPLDAGFAVDGWELPSTGRAPESRHARRAPAVPRNSGATGKSAAPGGHGAGLEDRLDDRLEGGLEEGTLRAALPVAAAVRVAGAVLAANGRRHGLDAGAAAAVRG